MSWETRRGRNRYYTRTLYAWGRRTRIYVGGGALGEHAAAEDAQRRAERKSQAEAWRQERARLLTDAAPLIELCHLTDLLLKATLLGAGFYQHHRGTWRRRRHAKNDNTA